jgi:phospholipid N-methyltransferase
MSVLQERRHSVRDNLRFLKLWLQRPVSLGAVIPSGRSLAAAMAGAIDPAGPGAVLELGGGTGSITEALIDAGIAARDIVVVEREAKLCDLLRVKFPEVRVVCGDATRLRHLLRKAGIGPLKAVVSGLPLLSIPKRAERLILVQSFEALQESGLFVQFTYGPAAPIARSVALALDIAGTRENFVPDNIPPAFVWVYRRKTEQPKLKKTA